MIHHPPYVEAVTMDNDSYFFQALWGRLKFALVVLVIVAAFVVLLWNLQPWLELEIKVHNSSVAVATK